MERMTSAEFRQRMGATPVVSTKPSSNAIRLPKQRKQSKAEAEYGRILQAEFIGCEVLYEAISFRLPSGTRYCPDWTVWHKRELVLIVEVKGGFRLGSAGASARAFKECIAAFPHLAFRHAHKTGDGWAKVEAGLK